MISSKSKDIITLSIVFTIGIAIGLLITKLKDNPKINKISESRSGGFELINPLYECNSEEAIGAIEYKVLEDEVIRYINEQKNKSDIEEVSIYFRDLNNGPWFGVNEKAIFSPASLLKLPVAITYLKHSEKDSDILNKKIKFEKAKYDSFYQLLDPKEKIQIGKEYDVNELIQKILIFSDNEALGLLKSNIDKKEITKTYRELGISLNGDEDNLTTVKDYSSIYRVLFNSSYLNTNNSIKLLELLTHVDFKEGLRKPIPENIKIANKFGERGIKGSSNVQLHDCGIVYFPEHPYLICVMTKGTDIEKQKTIIQTLSEKVYKENLRKHKLQ